MTPETKLFIRCEETTKDRFMGLHEKLGNKKMGETLDALLKANASGGEKALRVVELEAQLQNVDNAFKEAIKETNRQLREAQEKVNRATDSRKAAHNKYHALIRHVQRTVPSDLLVRLNLSKFMEQPSEAVTRPLDDVGAQLDYLRGGERE